MFYLTHLLLFKGAYYCIITVKGRLFGGLTDQYDDHHSIGYYELLDVKYRYLYAQRDLVRMMKKSIIAGKLNSEYVENPIIQVEDDSITIKDNVDRESSSSTQTSASDGGKKDKYRHKKCEDYILSSNYQWQWRWFLLMNITLNLLYLILFDAMSYNDNRDTKYVYYYYFFLWGIISFISRLLTLCYVILCFASMIHASYALQSLCNNWILRADQYKKITLSRYKEFVLESSEKGEQRVTSFLLLCIHSNFSLN
jgi:hypothetical protein